MKSQVFSASFTLFVTISVAGIVFGAANPAAATSLSWNWNYQASSIAASGTFITNDTPDSSGFYQIVGITGTRNGDTITGLQPAGTAIPGNEPYAVDDLVSLGYPQLTSNGFGFSTAAGEYINPFFADFLSPQVYLEFFSVPSSPSENTELPISFSASPAPVPEPSWLFGLLTLNGLVIDGAIRNHWQKREKLRKQH